MGHHQLTKLTDAMLQHLVLADKHLSFGLVESALIPSAQQQRIIDISANRGRAKPGRRSTTRSSTRSPRPPLKVGSSHVERATWVSVSRRLAEGASVTREGGAGGRDGLGHGSLQDSASVFGGRCCLSLGGLELLKLKLLLSDHMQQAVLIIPICVRYTAKFPTSHVF